MKDEAMPKDIGDWMRERNWGEHHDQWHFERRWDVWHARAAKPDADPDLIKYVEERVAKGYKRSSVQEGQPGNGEDFLFMHRAMIIVLLAQFPQYVHLLRGWSAVPLDPAAADDPVPGEPGNPAPPFDAGKAAGLRKLETQPEAFASDDGWGLFLETSDLPKPGDPLAKNPDLQTGAHNYMHNRWTYPGSDISLGAPTVNIYNVRFWRLHGWIDYQWWKFRKAKGFDDGTPAYMAKLQTYKEMMLQPHHVHHEHLAGVQMKAAAPPLRFNAFQFD